MKISIGGGPALPIPLHGGCMRHTQVNLRVDDSSVQLGSAVQRLVLNIETFTKTGNYCMMQLSCGYEQSLITSEYLKAAILQYSRMEVNNMISLALLFSKRHESQYEVRPSSKF
jgi:hypothetical protein